VFYTAIPEGESSPLEVWLYGLRQNGENRTNLALINTGESDRSVDIFRIELFNGDTGFHYCPVVDVSGFGNALIARN